MDRSCIIIYEKKKVVYDWKYKAVELAVLVLGNATIYEHTSSLLFFPTFVFICFHLLVYG